MVAAAKDQAHVPSRLLQMGSPALSACSRTPHMLCAAVAARPWSAAIKTHCPPSLSSFLFSSSTHHHTTPPPTYRPLPLSSVQHYRSHSLSTCACLTCQLNTTLHTHLIYTHQQSTQQWRRPATTSPPRPRSFRPLGVSPQPTMLSASRLPSPGRPT